MENRRIRIENGIITVPSESKMSISEIADLFGIYYQTTKKLIRDIEKQRSTERSVVKSGAVGGNYLGSCTVEGSKIYPDYYGLEMIITVAFRVQSVNANNFRKWIIHRITELSFSQTIMLSLQNSSLN